MLHAADDAADMSLCSSWYTDREVMQELPTLATASHANPHWPLAFLRLLFFSLLLCHLAAAVADVRRYLVFVADVLQGNQRLLPLA
jgi:hypothetical protein